MVVVTVFSSTLSTRAGAVSSSLGPLGSSLFSLLSTLDVEMGGAAETTKLADAISLTGATAEETVAGSAMKGARGGALVFFDVSGKPSLAVTRAPETSALASDGEKQ